MDAEWIFKICASFFLLFIAALGVWIGMTVKSKWALELLTCFAGGVLVSIALVHVLPDASEALEENLSGDFPYAATCFASAFLLMMSLEILMRTQKKVKHKSGEKKPLVRLGLRSRVKDMLKRGVLSQDSARSIFDFGQDWLIVSSWRVSRGVKKKIKVADQKQIDIYEDAIDAILRDKIVSYFEGDVNKEIHFAFEDATQDEETDEMQDDPIKTKELEPEPLLAKPVKAQLSEVDLDDLDSSDDEEFAVGDLIKAEAEELQRGIPSDIEEDVKGSVHPESIFSPDVVRDTIQPFDGYQLFDIQKRLQEIQDGDHRTGALAALIALTVHSLTEGFAVGVTEGMSQVVMLFTAVGVHKGFTGIALGNLERLRSKGDRGRMCCMTCISCRSWIFILASPVGILVGAGFTEIFSSSTEELVTGFVSAIMGGSVLHVALYDLLMPTLHSAKHVKSALFVCLFGFGIMTMLAIWA